jgi:hypothetical protein
LGHCIVRAARRVVERPVVTTATTPGSYARAVLHKPTALDDDEWRR